jgi:hypothetical protein
MVILLIEGLVQDPLKSESEESTPGVSASFSCEICNKSFASRGELRQHTIDNHSKTT